ncbi:NADH-quinone oxidoreductase subunit C [Balneolaceae bacterium YR4-1]|uniref:NADH-quinone oxidoreductase subunit C n=1 Tax=Halalkalibaculum roseum TaxID=2709311 RepID=A0A6M1SVR8_9BACT|nr:NADH-quinone oxidoreductase subunit C [Halalkalibaculum roseum]NGP76208.1 NADH-quinone oxidoreductase subunit C [Halalkalibaculum roseum]
MALELSEKHQEVIDKLSEAFPDSFIEAYQSSGDTFVRVEADAIVDICSFLKKECHFSYLGDVFGADNFTSKQRFEVVYNMVSLKDQIRLFVKVHLEESNPVIQSVTGVWKSANWPEREVYDMFGIQFTGHPDMRRIFMPQDFDYYPMRKEFPLLGIPGSIELPNTTPDTE